MEGNGADRISDMEHAAVKGIEKIAGMFLKALPKIQSFAAQEKPPFIAKL